jgi:hypothetical protein
LPRNINGDFSLVAGNPVVAGTDIVASWANSTLDDIKTALTDSLSRTGQGGMLYALLFGDGTLADPGIAWSQETATGWYRAGTNDTRFTMQGFGDVLRFYNGDVFIRNSADSAWVAVVYQGGSGSVPAGTAEGQTLIWDNTGLEWDVKAKNAGGELPVGNATLDALQWNNTTLAWEAVQPEVISSLINAGTVTNQSTRWDNTLLKWVPNSTITMTDAGVVTATTFVGALTGTATNSTQLAGQAAIRYPTSTTDSLKFVISATNPTVNNLDTITFVTA